MRTRNLLGAGALCVMFVPSAVQAQATTQRSIAGPMTYGTSSQTSYVIGAYEFAAFDAAEAIQGHPGTGDRFPTTGGAVLRAGVHLPNGAQILAIEVQGCDASATGELSVRLVSNLTSGGAQSEIDHGAGSTGAGNTPGCDYFGVGITPITVDNFNRTYYVQVTTGVTNNTVRFSAVRVFYLLQISTAPATATFSDVPVGHPFNRFVEALVAAGITGGCGGGNYCPDSPLTRGQMAVFLSTALGLHFPF
jgi:hypothetical protein